MPRRYGVPVWVEIYARGEPVAAAFGGEARGPSDRAYERLQTPDWQVFARYRDAAAEAG
jgi:hypothetical protein